MASLALLASGCASPLFRLVEREPDVRLLGAPTDEIVVTPNTRVDPSSYLRLELGSRTTDLLPATLLEVNDRGVLLRASLEGPVTEVKITGVSLARRNALFSADASTAVALLDDGVWVSGDDLRAWLAAAARLGTPEAREHWRVVVRRTEEGGRLTEIYLGGEVIAAHHGLPDRWEEFVSWPELNAFRTIRFNSRLPAALTVAAAGITWIGLSDLWFIDFLIGPAGGAVATFSGISPKHFDPRDYDDDGPLHLPLHQEAQPVHAAEAAGAQPIFTAAARRKHVVRPLLSVESGGEPFANDRSLGAGAWLGVRLFDRLELSGGPEAWWPEPLRPDGWVSVGPLQPRRPASQAYWLAAGRAQLIFDLDRERRISLLVGAQLSGGADDVWRVRIAWALQVRLVAGLFVNLRPFTPTYTFGWPAARWRVPSTFELGCSF